MVDDDSTDQSPRPERPKATEALPTAKELGTTDAGDDAAGDDGAPAEPPRASVVLRQRQAPGWFFFLYFSTIAACVYTLGAFINDVIVGGVLIALFRPAYDYLLVRLGRPWLCSALVVTLILLVMAAPLTFLVITLASEAGIAYTYTVEQLQLGGTGAGALLEPLRAAAARWGYELTPEELAGYVADAASAVRGAVLSQTAALFNNALTVLIHASVVLVVVFYLLVDGKRLKAFAFDLSPLPNEEEELLAERFGNVSRGILIGNGIGSITQGVFGGITMALVGLPSPVLWATVMSLFAFLPLVGVSVIIVPASGYLFFTGHYATALGFFALNMVWSLVMENVVKTRLIGRGTRMHDLLVFLSVLGGLVAFGILGLLYGPLLVAAFLTLTDLYREHYRMELALKIVEKTEE
jgi:predicted PurR-regulated permease PerM